MTQFNLCRRDKLWNSHHQNSVTIQWNAQGSWVQGAKSKLPISQSLRSSLWAFPVSALPSALCLQSTTAIVSVYECLKPWTPSTFFPPQEHKLLQLNFANSNITGKLKFDFTWTIKSSWYPQLYFGLGVPQKG